MDCQARAIESTGRTLEQVRDEYEKVATQHTVSDISHHPRHPPEHVAPSFDL